MRAIRSLIAVIGVVLLLTPYVAYGKPVTEVNVVNQPGFVLSPQVTAGSVVNPGASSTHDLVTLVGPGVFISAFGSKRGGASDSTDIGLFIDGTQVIGGNPASLRILGLTEMNPTGIAVFSGTLDTIAIGFPVPLIFENSLTLRADVGNSDTGVQEILGRVVHGK